MEKMYKVGIVDDEMLIRKSLGMLLDLHDDMAVNLYAANGAELLMLLAEPGQPKPEVILCDLEMDVMDGVETTQKVLEEFPDMKIIILSSHYEPGLIVKMVELGASAFLPKNESTEEFYKTIINVIKNGFHYNDQVVKLIRENMKFGGRNSRMNTVALTKREEEILNLICTEKSNKEIADSLCISPRTVEGHRSNLIEKTSSKNIAGLIIFAIENGYHRVNLKSKFWGG